MAILINNSDKQKIFPVVPIRDGTIFPHTDIVLTFGRPKSIAAIESAFNGDKTVCFVMQKDAKVNEPQSEDLYEIGTLGQIDRMLKTKGEINALVKGLTRTRIIKYEASDPFLLARVEELPEEFVVSDEATALVNHLTSEYRRAVNLGKSVDFLVFMNIMSGLSPSSLADQVASTLDIKSDEKQALLEEINVKIRLEKAVEYLNHEIKVLEIERKISTKTQERFDKNIREAVLRERLKTIEKELGEEPETKEFKELAV